MTVVVFALSFVFLLLAVVHINWAFGGKWGFEQAIPTTPSGERVLHPGKRDSMLVGVFLAGCCLFYFLPSEGMGFQWPQWMNTYLGWGLPAVFVLRAVGDFKYVGFFKRIRSTTFSKWDTTFFSPLCVLIGLVGWSIKWCS